MMQIRIHLIQLALCAGLVGLIFPLCTYGDVHPNEAAERNAAILSAEKGAKLAGLVALAEGLATGGLLLESGIFFLEDLPRLFKETSLEKRWGVERGATDFTRQSEQFLKLTNALCEKCRRTNVRMCQTAKELSSSLKEIYATGQSDRISGFMGQRAANKITSVIPAVTLYPRISEWRDKASAFEMRLEKLKPMVKSLVSSAAALQHWCKQGIELAENADDEAAVAHLASGRAKEWALHDLRIARRQKKEEIGQKAKAEQQKIQNRNTNKQCDCLWQCPFRLADGTRILSNGVIARIYNYTDKQSCREMSSVIREEKYFNLGPNGEMGERNIGASWEKIQSACQQSISYTQIKKGNKNLVEGSVVGRKIINEKELSGYTRNSTVHEYTVSEYEGRPIRKDPNHPTFYIENNLLPILEAESQFAGPAPGGCWDAGTSAEQILKYYNQFPGFEHITETPSFSFIDLTKSESKPKRMTPERLTQPRIIAPQ